jgi:hypothetical protein
MSQLDVLIEQDDSVQKYLDELGGDLIEQKRQQRPETFRDFCRFVDRTPDETAARKYRKRGTYAERPKEFQQQADGPWHAQVTRGNVVRSFFIANGSRLPSEQPTWL